MTTRNNLILILLLALALRLGLLLFFWDKPLTIVDEQHYQAIAENILNHHEFALKAGHPTSIRPPLYPAFLSSIYFLTGGIHYNAVRVVQIILSLGIICMVYLLGQNIFDRKTAILASFIFAIYPSFLFFTHFLLTEVLFTFLLLLFVYFFISMLKTNNTPSQLLNFSTSISHHPLTFSPSISPHPLHLAKRHAPCAFLAGLFLGLGALTRSILYPFLPIAIIFLFFARRGSLAKKIKLVILFAIGFSIVVGPWAVRNFKLYKDFVPIGTLGGLNLHMGNYEYTPLNRAWAAVELTGDKSWHYGYATILSTMNEAQKQKWAIKKAKEFILDHKLLTLKRDLIKAANFWGLERAVIGPIINGHWPELNKTPYVIGITFLIFTIYSIVLIASIFGILFYLELNRYNVIFIIVLIGFVTGMHAIVFGHSRYHLPFIPLLAIFASWSLLHLKKIWKHRSNWRFRFSVLLAMILICIWFREIVFIEGARFLSNIQ